MSETRYLDRPDQWDALVGLLLKSDPVAIDTEYLIDEYRSPAFHSEMHVWSIGWPATQEANARGIRRARAAVLPRAAIDHAPLRAYLEGPTEKWAHNAGVDRHAFANAGVELGGVRDSLSLYRWLMPGRVAPGPGFSLDALGLDLLGEHRTKTEEFRALVSRPRIVEVVKRTRRTVCTCGADKCRKRTGHSRHEEVTESTELVERGTERFPLSDIVPGHERWGRLVEYSGRDVLIGCELVQRARRISTERKLPW